MKMTRKLKVGAAVIMFCATPLAMAQEAMSDSGQWGYGGYLGTATIDSNTAQQEGIEDSAWVLGFSADYRQKSWKTSLGLDLIFYDDNQEFTQYVEGSGIYNDGDISRQSSSANGYLVHAATGYQWLFTEDQNLAVSLQGGIGLMVSSERSIGSCENCYSEDIDVDGGAFAKVAVEHTGDSLAFGLFAQQYFGDGLGTVFGVSLSSSF